MFVLAIDAMGGDYGPSFTIPSLNRVVCDQDDVDFLIYGDEDLIKEHSSEKLLKRSTIIPVTQVVSSEDRPSLVLRTGRLTSMGLAISAVREKKADAVVSAGNTGALMAMSKFFLRVIPGIDRPAITSILPTVVKDVVMLDLGANTECAANNLVDFAIMGSLYAQVRLGVSYPKVGLLNIGTEEAKGTDSLKEALRILQNAKNHKFSFQGFIEGDDIGRGDIDVVVTDGFTGNITLKTIEGTAKMMKNMMTEAFQSSWSSRLGYCFARNSLEVMSKRVDPNRYNGALFLGLNGVSVKAHGSSSVESFYYAVLSALSLVENKLNDRIKQEYDSFFEELPVLEDPSHLEKKDLL